MDRNKAVSVLSTISENITKVSSINSAEEKLGKLVGELSGLHDRIVRKEIEIRQAIRFVNIVKNVKKRDFDSVSIELLTNDKRILDIAVSGKTITILTNDLYYHDSRTNRKHLLGKFLIESSFGYYRSTKAYNITMQVIGALVYPQDGPHIMSDNHCCLGNTERLFEECMISQDPTGLIILLLSFVESVNVDDSAGVGIENWPFVTPGGLMAVDPKRIVRPRIEPELIQKFGNLGLNTNLINSHLNDAVKFGKFHKSIGQLSKSS